MSANYDHNYDVPPGWGDSNQGDSQGPKLKFTKGISVGFGHEGDYDSDWSSVPLPSTPTRHKWCIRENTNVGNEGVRIYIYSNSRSSWWYVDLTEVV